VDIDPDDGFDTRFALGEALADFALYAGATEVRTGDRSLVHARRPAISTEPLTGFGATVRTGDLVQVDGAQVGFLNLYSVEANTYNFVGVFHAASGRTGNGYGISFASLGWGPRRVFRLLDPAPRHWVPYSNATLSDDRAVAELDARMKAAGHPRTPNWFDTPIVRHGQPGKVDHAVPHGFTRTVCGRAVTTADGAVAFADGDYGTCRRCSTSVYRAAEAAGNRPSTTLDRGTRAKVYVDHYGDLVLGYRRPRR
jgi:hypothetical protein